MHELSIIQHIIDIATEELCCRGKGQKVEAIDLEIGELAGVEIESLEFLWEAAVSDTALDCAVCHIHRIPGEGKCSDCQTIFPLARIFDPCPHCGSHWINISNGEELRIQSITLVDPPVAASEGHFTY